MDAELTGSNKRRYERVRVRSCKFLLNLSVGGAFVITRRPRQVGSMIHFEIKLGKKARQFRALAKIVRVLHKPDPRNGEPAGMAVEFVKMEPEDEKTLREYLKECKNQNPLREDVFGD